MSDEETNKSEDAEEPRADPAPAGDDADPGQAPEVVYTQAQVDELVLAARADAKERLVRLAAEYENFRRRAAKEREQWTAEALERFAKDLLPVLDSFERALAARQGGATSLLEGVQLTQRQLENVLVKHGIEPVDPMGQPFDPRFHEAIVRAPSPDAAPGTVTAVLENGYTLSGRLLRPARVQVAGDV